MCKGKRHIYWVHHTYLHLANNYKSLSLYPYINNPRTIPQNNLVTFENPIAPVSLVQRLLSTKWPIRILKHPVIKASWKERKRTVPSQYWQGKYHGDLRSMALAGLESAKSPEGTSEIIIKGKVRQCVLYPNPWVSQISVMKKGEFTTYSLFLELQVQPISIFHWRLLSLYL